MAIAARMPMMATTVRSSSKVNPRWPDSSADTLRSDMLRGCAGFLSDTSTLQPLLDMGNPKILWRKQLSLRESTTLWHREEAVLSSSVNFDKNFNFFRGTSASGGVYPRFDNLRRSFAETGRFEATEKEKKSDNSSSLGHEIGMQCHPA